MASRAIYYPYIQVPDSPWFTRTLLYWDQVGAIVPYEYIENPELLGHHMVGLVRENLVQVVPSMHLWKVPRFDAAFLEHLDRRSSPPQGSRVIAADDWSRIHMEKLQGLADALCLRGLARKDDTVPYSPWYRIQRDIADEFMAYLSAVLGQIPGEDEFAPVTDQVGQLSRFRPRAPALGGVRQ